MARGARHGNAVEVKVAHVLQDDGWLVASRRHIGGAGDLLATRPRSETIMVDRTSLLITEPELWLIEVKSTVNGPYENFRPADRQALRDLAMEYGAQAYLAWWPPRHGLQLIHSSDWPTR